MEKNKNTNGPIFDIDVELLGQDGNAFFIIGRIEKEMRRAGVSKRDMAEFREEAMSGDYNNVLTTAMKWVNVC